MDIDENEPYWLPVYTKQYMDLVVGKYHTTVAGKILYLYNLKEFDHVAICKLCATKLNE